MGDVTALGDHQHRSARVHGTSGRHRLRHGHASLRHRPGRYEVHRARVRSRSLTMVVMAGLGLALLVALIGLVESGRDVSWQEPASAGGSEPWK